jgi:hypothetical protein
MRLVHLSLVLITPILATIPCPWNQKILTLSVPKFPSFLFASFPILLQESLHLECTKVERSRQLDALVAFFMLHSRTSFGIYGTGRRPVSFKAAPFSTVSVAIVAYLAYTPFPVHLYLFR